MAAPSFEVSIAQPTIELGKPVWMTLKTGLSAPSLNEIDFSVLDEKFEVIKDKNGIRYTNKGQAWRIRLYPRNKGTFTIAPLSFAGNSSQAFKVQIRKPTDSKTGQAFDIEYLSGTASPWVRQQVLVTYKIQSRESKLVLEPQQTEINNMLLVPLATATQQQAEQFIHTSGWAVFPRQQGKQTFKLPALHYIRDSVITHRFYPPRIRFNVKALPNYLPGNIPVGKLSFNAISQPAFVLKNSLDNIALALSGRDIPPQWLPDIRHLFTSPQDMAVYPVESQTLQTRTGNINSSHKYHLPFKAVSQGSIHLPSIRLHYFDPHTGKLAQLSLPPIRMFALSGWLLLPLSLLAFGLTIWLLRISYAWLMPHWHCLRAYHVALKQLPQLESALEFKQLIADLSEGEGWSSNLSLRQWQARLPGQPAEPAKQINQQLEEALYRGDSIESELLRTGFRQVCLNRWPVLRWVGVSQVE